MAEKIYDQREELHKLKQKNTTSGGTRECTDSLENEQILQSHLEKRYTTQDMLEAFKHGREFEQIKGDSDMICGTTPTKNLPFYEWIARFPENKEHSSPSADG